MCGRCASFLPAEALARIFGTVNPMPNFETTWNMAPTRDAPVIRLSKQDERYLDAMKWGLVPYFTKDLKKARKPINARSETVATSGMFREAFARRRCLVPAPAYYEWRDDPDGKTPFAVARVGGREAKDLRHDHHQCQRVARPDPGSHAGDHRAGRLAGLAWRGDRFASAGSGGGAAGVAGRQGGRQLQERRAGADRVDCGIGADASVGTSDRTAHLPSLPPLLPNASEGNRFAIG
jgi:SOS response associated peptidase (SRAP)